MDTLRAPPRKTYSHLAALRRMPSQYELVTSKLLYYPERGFEVDVPLRRWYEQYQQGSPLKVKDWERFCDPRETTYTKYTSLQRDSELFIDGILQSIDELDYDHRLGAPWRHTLARVLGPARYLFHGLQMVAAYIGQLAPCGRIVITALLQTADELRRVQRAAYRLCQLQQLDSQLGADSKARWQDEPLWQPVRQTVERLLVTYDWGEALTGLNLCLKPLLDELVMVHFAVLAWQNDDPLLQQIFGALNRDCQWHRAWSLELYKVAVAESADNQTAIQSWVERWHPLALAAVSALAPLLATAPGAALAELSARLTEHLAPLGIKLSERSSPP